MFHGKVTLEDGSLPGHGVLIQQRCDGAEQPMMEGFSSRKTGEYYVRLYVNEYGRVQSGVDMNVVLGCVLEASDRGYVSSRLDLTDRSLLRKSLLPPIILTPKSRSTTAFDPDITAPRAASRNWKLAIRQLTAGNPAAAEAPLRAVVEEAPKFPAGWSALGTLDENLGKSEEAGKAMAQAIALNPKPLAPYLVLAHAEIDVKDWKAAAATSQSLIDRDTKHNYVEAYFLAAVALYQMQDFDNAQAHIVEAIRLDKLRELPRAEFVLGTILEAKKDYTGAEQHLRTYVQQHPRAKDVAKVNDRLANLGKEPPEDLAGDLTPLDMQAAAAGEAPVPGGIKAFSAIAQLKGTPSPDDFFLDYCRAIAGSGSGTESDNPTRDASDDVKTFIAVVQALEDLGEPTTDGTLIRIALASQTDIRRSQTILAELGLKVVVDGASYAIQPGGRPNDGLRQWALAALGVDEFALRQAVREKREFTFRIPREDARLMGGPAWGVVLKGVPEMAGGPVDAFMRDWRFARVYSGLGAMDNDSAAAVVASLTLGNLIVKYSNLMAAYGEAIAMADNNVAVPGGANAEPIWAKLAGADPKMPGPFLRALFEKDQGHLLAFYYDLMHADAAHQQYFTRTSARAEAFYKWYRDSAPAGPARDPDHWQAKLLQHLRFNASGRIEFPGGRDAWSAKATNDDDALLLSGSLEAFAAVSELEQKRGAPLSEASAQLVARHFREWRSLFPYFEKLPALDAPAFEALAAFTVDATKLTAPQRNLPMGEWHSLVKLIVLGVQAGSVTNAQAAQLFQQACDSARQANPSAAVAVLRAMAGGSADLDEAVPTQLLRLSGARREAFDNVKKLQNVPSLRTAAASPNPATTLDALSGVVYAALLDPAYLLVAEDPQLLTRHNFVPFTDLFAPSSLDASSEPPGSNFSGGFAAFEVAARALRRQTEGALAPEPDAPETPATSAATNPATPANNTATPAGTPAPAPEHDPVFQAEGRIVEVYTTVTDSRGHYVDDLHASQFSVKEDGRPTPVFAFENQTSGVSVALLFDTTGSMVGALPSLKDAAMQLVADLRANDSVAVYSFSDSVNALQPFTSDKEAASRAILKTHAQGMTALYDALVRVNHDLSARGGKKVVIVFTDGSDNSSMLTANAAIERAKTRGIPIYTIAEGEALDSPKLIAELARMSQSTGGSDFLIRKLSDIGEVFEKVSEDLMHGYLVAFQPSPGNNGEWRKIDVALTGQKGLQVRAREGFYGE